MTEPKNTPAEALARAEADIEASREAAGAARAIVERLRESLAEATARKSAVADEVNAIAFAALAEGQQKAKARLVELRREAVEVACEIAALEAAGREAESRDEAAQRALKAAVDRRRAVQTLVDIREVAAKATKLDEMSSAYFSALSDIADNLDRVARGAGGRPTLEQVRVMFTRAVTTAAITSRAVFNVGVIAPADRTTFEELIGSPDGEGWLGQIGAWARDKITATRTESA